MHLPLGGDAKMPANPIVNSRLLDVVEGETGEEFVARKAAHKKAVAASKAKARREEQKEETVICPHCHESMPKLKYAAHKKKMHAGAPKEERLTKKNYMN
jgi:hypothetical protein